jgi:phosphotriesterase-related protein
MALMTVLGAIKADEVGPALVHEHIAVTFAGTHFETRPQLSREERLARAVQRLREIRDLGIRTFVDPCPMDCGRDVSLMAEAAQQSGVQIVAATGFYHERDGIGIPYYWRMRWPEEIAELYLSELHNGVGDTGIRPGVIKLATGDPVGVHEQKVMIAAGIAARESGVPVITHCHNSMFGDVQQDILEQQGADLTRCLIGHQDQQTDLDALLAIARRGSFIGIDRIGMQTLAPDTQRADMIVRLIQAGVTDNLCISMDHMCYDPSPRPAFWISKERAEEVYRMVMPQMDYEFAGHGFTYLFTEFLPLLRERGVGQDIIDRLLVDNPRRLLCGTSTADAAPETMAAGRHP